MKSAIAALVLVGTLVPAAPVHAAPPDPRPTVTIVDIARIEGSSDHRIRIEAVDPNGVIGEIVVDFGDGATVWLLLACQEPGVPVVEYLDWSYSPGNYVVRAYGYSMSGCFEGSIQESRVDREHLRVTA